jgi:aflatoxin B1 aldehyde reductase
MVKVIAGTMGRTPFAVTPEQYKDFLDCCKKYNVTELDSARIYGGGDLEKILGESLHDFHFEVSTKINILKQGSLKQDAITASAKTSLADLGTNQVDIFYIHRPDRKTPLEETCAAINDLYKEGKFKRFGICGYRADEVQDIYTLCKSNGYVLPTVYQGIFNPVTRRAEFDLFPTLRKLGIQFYAYGPLASGLLIRPVEELLNATPDSRFGAMPMAAGIYLKEPITSKVKHLQETCKSQGVPLLDATFGYLLHHSALAETDGVIVGASSVAQLETNLKATKAGPLPSIVVQAFEDLWEQVKDESGPYHH